MYFIKTSDTNFQPPVQEHSVQEHSVSEEFSSSTVSKKNSKKIAIGLYVIGGIAVVSIAVMLWYNSKSAKLSTAQQEILYDFIVDPIKNKSIAPEIQLFFNSIADFKSGIVEAVKEIKKFDNSKFKDFKDLINLDFKPEIVDCIENIIQEITKISHYKNAKKTQNGIFDGSIKIEDLQSNLIRNLENMQSVVKFKSLIGNEKFDKLKSLPVILFIILTEYWNQIIGVAL